MVPRFRSGARLNCGRFGSSSSVGLGGAFEHRQPSLYRVEFRGGHDVLRLGFEKIPGCLSALHDSGRRGGCVETNFPTPWFSGGSRLDLFENVDHAVGVVAGL